jgi:hypothetical protein
MKVVSQMCHATRQPGTVDCCDRLDGNLKRDQLSTAER